MYTIHKLKPNRNFTGLLLSLGWCAAGGLLAAILGSFQVFFYFLAAVFLMYALFGILTSLRTRNPAFLVVASFQIFGMLLMISNEQFSVSRSSSPTHLFVVVGTFFFLAWTLILLFTRKIKWRGSEVLELAASSVEQSGNGFTNRPLPAGRTEFDRQQIEAFARFMLRNLVAVPYSGEDKIVLAPVRMGIEFPYLVGLKGDYTPETWVAFGFDGNVTVNISRKDYMSYREALSFNELCASLGRLFVEFIEVHQNGEGERIIDRLDSTGLSAFE